MKNSKEEDIKIIENLKEAINSGLCYFGSVKMYDCGYQEALNHILSDYKRVLKTNEVLLKENEELKNKLDNSRKANEFLNKKNDEIRREKSLMYSKAVNDIIKGWNLEDDFVPVQKVEDKIKYLDKQQKQWLEDRELKASDSEIIFAKNFLQELLENNHIREKENVNFN